MRSSSSLCFFFICLFVISVVSVDLRLIQTAESTLDRLKEKPALSFTSGSAPGSNLVTVDHSQRFQTIFGFGGAFTEAAALNYHLLNPTLQQQILEAYWGENGIGYSMARVHMNSCDFSLFSYNFDNVTGDTSLSHFDNSVTHDQRTMIPFILQANQTAMKTGNPIWLFLTPWSPPAWMKVPEKGKQSMDGSASPNGLQTQYMQSWALYFSKFISAYKQSGVNIWGLTPQNEPEYAAPYEACKFTADFESNFIANYLGPQMQQDFPDIKIMGYDHNRDDIYNYASILYSNETTKQYLSGIAFHWYVGNQLYNVNRTYYLDTSKFVLATEGCNCPGVELGNWYRAETYGRDIIADLNFFSVGWLDWNLVLNTFGGPNHAQNYCDAMIIADIERQGLYFQPSYYYMGQISKFVPRGSTRIASSAQVIFNTPSDQQPQVGDNDNVILSDCNLAANQRWTTNFNSDFQPIQLTNSDQCLDIDWTSGESGDGVNVQINTCKSERINQKWSFNQTTGQITSNALPGYCLDVLNYSVQPGANIQMWSCTGNSNQQWTTNSDGTIRSVSSGLCLTPGWSAFQHVAFETPSGETVLIVMNSSDNSLNYSIQDSNLPGQYASTTIPAHAIQTYLWKN